MYLGTSDAPPVYQIDLSLPPASRYLAVAEKYAPQLRGLMQLFDELLGDAGLPSSLFPWIRRLARLLVRRVHNSEENLELQGISRATQVPMYFLVCFNVILDLLMGCTSGAVRTVNKGQALTQSKMLHFRTLDWTMDPLREVVVQLDFVRSASKTPDKVLARSITYVGFVGVLTGVRHGFSVSLNYRPQHNADTFMDHIRFYAHHLRLLFGRRQSISSLLRSCLFSEHHPESENDSHLDSLTQKIMSTESTAAYLVLSDGQSTIAIEKDRVTQKIWRSHSFIVVTNHDLDSTRKPSTGDSTTDKSLLECIVAESIDRRNCIVEKWTKQVQKEQRKRNESRGDLSTHVNSDSPENGTATSRSSTISNVICQDSSEETTKPLQVAPGAEAAEENVSVTPLQLRRWLSAWPTTNECTHFSAVLDPTDGKVVWARRYRTPVEAPPSFQTRSSYATP